MTKNDPMFLSFYAAYKDHGGRKNEDRFLEAMAKFTEIIVFFYTGGGTEMTPLQKQIWDQARSANGSARATAWGFWVKAMATRSEAERIFKAVDSVAPVS